MHKRYRVPGFRVLQRVTALRQERADFPDAPVQGLAWTAVHGR